MANSPVSVNDAVVRLVASKGPVLFCDTCALLDIVRIPARGWEPKVAARVLAAASTILSDATAGKTDLVLPPLVRSEWDKNLPGVEEEAKRALENIQNGYDLASAIQDVRGQSLPSVTIPGEDITQYLRGLGTGLVNAGMDLAEEPDASLRATSKAAMYVAPATKGAIKDSLIYEHAITVMKLLREAGHCGALVFLTSNTRDFCESGTPKEPLRTDLGKVVASLCTDWDWALHDLSMAGLSETA